MKKFTLYKTSNLAEAQNALAKLLPHLPWPQLTEVMDACGAALLPSGADANLPTVEQPETLVARLGPCVFDKLPEHWKVPYNHHKQRLRRNGQFVRLHSACLVSTGNVPMELNDSLDGVVAGVLLFVVKPLPSPLRTALLRRAASHWWGMFFAAQGMVFADEATTLLPGIANEPRLAAALWRQNPDLGEPLVSVAMRRNDLWSAIIALEQPLAAEWLGRVSVFAANNSIAALTALALQPSAPIDFKNGWVERLRVGPPRLAYLAARWTQHTWPKNEWLKLREVLKANICSDALAWFHFYRDVMTEQIDDALREANVPVLWSAELVHHAKNQGQALRRRMTEQLLAKPGDREALLTLQWLSRRGRLT